MPVVLRLSALFSWPGPDAPITRKAMRQSIRATTRPRSGVVIGVVDGVTFLFFTFIVSKKVGAITTVVTGDRPSIGQATLGSLPRENLGA
jgi:hypothetical protein